jgi:hypothetical protein
MHLVIVTVFVSPDYTKNIVLGLEEEYMTYVGLIKLAATTVKALGIQDCDFDMIYAKCARSQRYQIDMSSDEGPLKIHELLTEIVERSLLGADFHIGEFDINVAYDYLNEECLIVI